MPSFIIVGYVWQVLGWRPFCHLASICLQPRKDPSWIGLKKEQILSYIAFYIDQSNPSKSTINCCSGKILLFSDHTIHISVVSIGKKEFVIRDIYWKLLPKTMFHELFSNAINKTFSFYFFLAKYRLIFRKRKESNLK